MKKKITQKLRTGFLIGISLYEKWAEGKSTIRRGSFLSVDAGQIILVSYYNKKQDLQFQSASAYMQAYMILVDYFSAVFFIAVEVSLLCSILCPVANLLELRLLCPESPHLELVRLLEDNVESGICITYLSRKGGELGCRCYTVRDGTTDNLELLTNGLNAFKGAVSFLVEPLSAMIHLMLIIFSREEVMEEKKIRKFWNPTENYDVQLKVRSWINGLRRIGRILNRDR